MTRHGLPWWGRSVGSVGSLDHSIWPLKALNMVIRKLLLFNTVLGLTLPKQYTNAMNLKRGDYVEVNLMDKDSILIMTHDSEPKKITESDK